MANASAKKTMRRGAERRNTLLIVFNRYAAKAPVHVPSAQRSADQAYNEFKTLLTEEEKSALSIERGHAIDVGEGRAKFDAVCSRIRTRLFG